MRANSSGSYGCRTSLPAVVAARGNKRPMRPTATTFATTAIAIADDGDATTKCCHSEELPDMQQRTLPLHESLKTLPGLIGDGQQHPHRLRRRRRQWRPSRPRPRKILGTTIHRYCPLAFIVLAHLSTCDETTSSSPKNRRTNNNLRKQKKKQKKKQQQNQNQENQQTIFITTPRDYTGCIDQWHISIENSHACTNSPNFPSSWATSSSVRDTIFHPTAEACCMDILASSFRKKCDVINTCTPVDEFHDTDKYLDEVVASYSTCGKNTWHMSTEILYACTNDGVYPTEWNESEEHLFRSGKECCQRSYPYQQCEVIDSCPTPGPTKPPTPRPTRPPRTRKPKPGRPTNKPTRKPRVTPEPTTTPPDWYVDRTRSQCVMDCTDEPRRPCGGPKPAWENNFPTMEACCASISWISPLECAATASPTQKQTNVPTRDKELQGDYVDTPPPTLNPTVYIDWYKKQSTNQCVLNCENMPGRTCGGLATQWDTRYSSVEECCATVPWKKDCATTASPVTASPTTPPPTVSPTSTRAPSQSIRPSGEQPSDSPTLKPTSECPAPYWYLYRNNAGATCINEPNYSDDTIIPSMKFYLSFDSADECCQSPFIGGANCQVIDVCLVLAWYADYSRGWDDGVCITNLQAPVPKGRRTYDKQLECCSEGFFGQSSEACISDAMGLF